MTQQIDVLFYFSIGYFLYGSRNQNDVASLKSETKQNKIVRERDI